MNIHTLSQLSYAQKMVQIQRLQARALGAKNLEKFTVQPQGQSSRAEVVNDSEDEEEDEEMNIDDEYVDIEQNSDDENGQKSENSS